MKKLVAGVAVAAIGISSAVGASALEWKVKRYDTTTIERTAFNTFRVGIVYEQQDDNGLSTGVVVDKENAEAYGLKPYAVATFTAPSFEKAWPNREYVTLLADGVNTEQTLYTGAAENLEYRDAAYMWDLAAPHAVTTRKQAKIGGTWYTDATYPTKYSGDVATVKSEYSNAYGVGKWHIVDGKAVYMPAVLQEYASVDEGLEIIEEVDTDTYVTTGVAANALVPGAVTDLTGVLGNDESVKIKKTFNYVVSGPVFNFDGTVTAGNEYAEVHNSADFSERIRGFVYGESLDWFGVDDLVKNVYYYNGTCALAETAWVDAGYEAAMPHRLIQYLKVDGVVMDGSMVAVEDGKSTIADVYGNSVDVVDEMDLVRLPKIYRYIEDSVGGTAQANVSKNYNYNVMGGSEDDTRTVDDITVIVTE